MNTTRIDRLGAASGVVGSGLIFAGLMLTLGATETINPDTSAQVVAFEYAFHRDDIRLGVTLALTGVFFTAWFLGFLRHRVATAEGQRGWLAPVLFGGGLIGLGGVLVHLAVLVAATNSSIVGAPETARTLLIFSWEYGGVLAPAFGAFVGAASLAVVRHAMLPRITRPVAWLGLPLGLALATSGFLGGALVVASLLWLVALSASLLVAAPHGREAPASRAVSPA